MKTNKTNKNMNNVKMNVTYEQVDRFLRGETSMTETLAVLDAIATDLDLEEYVVTERRLKYASEQIEEYGCFIPIRSMAADDGKNLCDFQCESYILKTKGIETEESVLSERARQNYWLRGEGTPLYNIGKLLESEGLLVKRCADATISKLLEELKEHMVIAIVNGESLASKKTDRSDDLACSKNNPNHAVVVLEADESTDMIKIYNPAAGEEEKEYNLGVFESAWAESKNFMVTVREKRFPQEYEPQPIDVSKVKLDDDLIELTETIAQDVHDVWAVKRIKEGWKYGPVRDDAKKHNPDLVPYSDLPESEKDYDRDMATHAIKVIKRLGYRIVNINSMYRCPDCGEIIEPSNNFCPNCGRKLSWEDFR